MAQKKQTKKASSGQIPVYDMAGKEVGKIELPEKLFGLSPEAGLLHEAVTVHESNQRAGSAHTKTRSEISGGGAKPWRQKGTGRARQGSNRSPIWRKGGVVFGPRNERNWTRGMPRRKGRLALAQALSLRASDGALRIVDALKLDGGKTKQVAQALKALKADNKSVIVIDQVDATLQRAARNIKDLKIVMASHLSAYDVLVCRNLIVTKGALEKLAPKFN